MEEQPALHPRFEFAQAARVHAELTVGPSGGLSLRDVGSKNGTFLNGDRIAGVIQESDGDTVTLQHKPASESIGGYRDPKPMVYSGLYPIDGSDYPLLREALDKLLLNDAALVYEPETSAALGFGFRCGFLGLLHLEIIQERLSREFNLDLIATAPSVVYKISLRDGSRIRLNTESRLRVTGDDASLVRRKRASLPSVATSTYVHRPSPASPPSSPASSKPGIRCSEPSKTK